MLTIETSAATPPISAVVGIHKSVGYFPWRSATLKPFRTCRDDIRSNKRRPNYDATLHNLELIGKAATHLPNTVRKANPHILWRFIIAS